MHPRHALVALLILGGVLFAQDTNFPVGPQYLAPTGSTLFLQPIATPTLSLGEVPPPARTTTEAEIAQEAPVPSAVTNETFLSDVYWGDHPASEVEARRAVTPSLSLSQPALNVSTNAAETGTTTSNPLPGLPALQAASSVIEMSSAPLPANLPASIFNDGVTHEANVESILERGYGVSLGEVAAYWKSHKPNAAHVFTNRDVEHVHAD